MGLFRFFANSLISLTNKETAPAYPGVKFSLYGNNIAIFFIKIILNHHKQETHYLEDLAARNHNLDHGGDW